MNEQERAAMQQALEALEAGPDVDPIFAGETEAALRAALAQQPEPAQEPDFHGFMSADGTQVDLCFTPSVPRSDGTYATAYYTAPPQRPPLTDAEMRKLWSQYGYKSALCMRFARAIKRKVRGETE